MAADVAVLGQNVPFCPCGGNMLLYLRLSRFKPTRPPTPRDTEVSNASAVMHDSLGSVCVCSLSGINSSVGCPENSQPVKDQAAAGGRGLGADVYRADGAT